MLIEYDGFLFEKIYMINNIFYDFEGHSMFYYEMPCFQCELFLCFKYDFLSIKTKQNFKFYYIT